MIFLEEIEQFQLKYNQEVKYLFQHLSETLQHEVSQRLLEILPHRYRSYAECYRVTKEDLFRVAHYMFVPNDTQHFLYLLKKACSKYEVKQNSKYFSQVKTELASLKVKFIERFIFLKKACKKLGREDIIPLPTFKPGGLLTIWMDLTPEKTREPFRMELRDKFSDVNDFMRKYFEVVDKVYNLSEAAKAYEAKTGQSSSNAHFAKPNSNTSSVKLNTKSYVNSFVHVEEEEFDTREDVDEDEEVTGVVNAVSEATKKLICYSLLCYSKCDKMRECRYDHDLTRIRSEREKIVYLCRKEAEKEQSTKGMSVQPRQLPGQQGGVRLLKKEEQLEDDSMVNELVSSTFLEEDPVLGALTSYEVTHEIISLSIRGKMFSKIGVALLDTGASHEDFISLDLVRKLGLEEWIQPVASSVRTADGRLVQLKGRLTAQLSFQHEDGTTYEGTLDLTIFDGLNVPVIIGIKSILKHFSAAFMNKIQHGSHLNAIDRKLSSFEVEAVEKARECPMSSSGCGEGECEEESSIPEPQSFPNSHLEGNDSSKFKEEEAIYHEEISAKIPAGLLAVDGVLEFFHGDVALRVFVPDNWEGVSGVEPLKLEFNDDMPRGIKPPPRPIPPRLMERIF